MYYMYILQPSLVFEYNERKRQKRKQTRLFLTIFRLAEPVKCDFPRDTRLEETFLTSYLCETHCIAAIFQQTSHVQGWFALDSIAIVL